MFSLGNKLCFDLILLKKSNRRIMHHFTWLTCCLHFLLTAECYESAGEGRDLCSDRTWLAHTYNWSSFACHDLGGGWGGGATKYL